VADVRKARRDAEKAAREALSQTLVGVAGELGVALAEERVTAADVEAARTKSAEIIASAKREARSVLDAAESIAASASATYAHRWVAAKDAGWTAAQLRAMGYDQPVVARKRKSSDTPTADHATPTGDRD
jgi:hypothetical protein